MGNHLLQFVSSARQRTRAIWSSRELFLCDNASSKTEESQAELMSNDLHVCLHSSVPHLKQYNFYKPFSWPPVVQQERAALPTSVHTCSRLHLQIEKLSFVWLFFKCVSSDLDLCYNGPLNSTGCRTCSGQTVQYRHAPVKLCIEGTFQCLK